MFLLIIFWEQKVSFRTLNVEVYHNGELYLNQVQYSFRTLNVEVYLIGNQHFHIQYSLKMPV